MKQNSNDLDMGSAARKSVHLSLRTHIVALADRLKRSRIFTTALKIAVTAFCLWYVSQKINWLLTWQLLLTSKKWWLLAAAILFTLSKLVSAFRLNIYFRNIDVRLSAMASIKLYWLGMFYNLFFPGGIGGDAYKVMLLYRRHKQTVKKLGAAVLLDRISGVAGLALLGIVYYFLIFKGSLFSWWALAAILPGLIIYFVLVKKLFPSFISSYWSTLWLGIVVQFLQVLCVYSLMASIQVTGNHNQFVLLFLLSSVVAILPFTIGGLGAREVVFLWGSRQFLLDVNQAIYISILFYLVTVVVSLVGSPLNVRLPRSEAPKSQAT